MVLDLCDGRDDSKDLEGVLPVFERRLYDGGDGSVVHCIGLWAESSDDMEFCLYGPGGILAAVVCRRDIDIL